MPLHCRHITVTLPSLHRYTAVTLPLHCRYTAVTQVIKQTGLATIALSLTEGKVACLASVPEDRVGALPANTWLQTVLKEVSGRGGGKPAQAQGSGPEVANLAKAVEVASQVASEAFGA